MNTWLKLSMFFVQFFIINFLALDSTSDPDTFQLLSEPDPPSASVNIKRDSTDQTPSAPKFNLSAPIMTSTNKTSLIKSKKLNYDPILHKWLYYDIENDIHCQRMELIIDLNFTYVKKGEFSLIFP